MPTGREVMEAVGILLNDEDHVRWTLPELCRWINEAVKATVLAKPSACTATQQLTLALGTLQSVPTTGSPKPLALLDIVRNLDNSGGGGRAIRVVKRELLDAEMPDWHNTAVVAAKAVVRNFTFDEQNPLRFYTYPANDGTGKVEAVLSVLPAELTAAGDDSDIGSYAADLGLPELYLSPLTDFVVSRCFTKDDQVGDVGRSQKHYNQFATAVGLKIQVEGATSPNAKRVRANG